MVVKEVQSDKKTKKKSLVTSIVAKGAKKTCVLGFKTTVHSIFDLSRELFDDKENPVKKFYTYLVQQDYLEHFFSLIRHHGGWNDNPIPIQIKYIMRKLIVIKCGGLSTSLNMNCSTVHVDFEFVESDSVPENFMETIIEFSGQLTHQPDSVHAPVLDNFKRRVLCFIGGYIVKKLLPHVTCKECKAALVNNVEDPLDTADERLIQLKTNGALLSPAKSTFEIIIKAEEVFQTEVIGKNKPP